MVQIDKKYSIFVFNNAFHFARETNGKKAIFSEPIKNCWEVKPYYVKLKKYDAETAGVVWSEKIEAAIDIRMVEVRKLLAEEWR